MTCDTCQHKRVDVVGERELKLLFDYFDRVVVINLKRRPDRLATFKDILQKCQWPFKEPILFEAIDGNKVPTPVGWVAGGGTWGCMQSHRQVLERAIHDDVENILVLEDDLTVRNTFLADIIKFLKEVPDDWDQLMLGGQHIHAASPFKPGLVKCLNCQRTHAYAIRGTMLRDLYATWCSASSVTHCDHIMGPMQSRYHVYAPDPFVFGQIQSKSDISGALNPTKFWQAPTGKEPLYVLDCPIEVVVALREYGVHTGYNRDPTTDIDNGLIAVFNNTDVESHLRKWVSDLQWECASAENTVLGVWHPKATEEMLRKCWSGPVSTITAATIGVALAKMKLGKNMSKQAIIVLRTSKTVAEQVRKTGWHMGIWLDPVTGYDNGLRQWAIDKQPDKLRRIVDVLVQEASGIENGVACIWFPEVTIEQIQAVTNIRLVEIYTSSVEDAHKQWQAAIAKGNQ